MRLPRPAWFYLYGVVLAALGLYLYWFRSWHGPQPTAALGLLALLAVLAVVAQQFPLVLSPRYQVNVAPASYFAALLLGGPPAAMALVGISQSIGGGLLAVRRNPRNGLRRRGLVGVVFNTGQLVLATGVAGLVYYAPSARGVPVPLGRPTNLWAVPATAATFFLVTGGLVAVMIALQRGRHPGTIWRAGWRDEALESAGLALLGLITALLATHYPWAPLLLVPPAAVLHLAVGRTVASIEALAAAEAAARASEERFRALVQQAADIIAVIDDTGRFRYASPAATRCLGYPPEKFVGTRGEAIVFHPDDRHAALRGFRTLRARPGDTLATEVRIAHRDGVWRHFEVQASNLLDDASVRGIVVNARDITERKRAEARLQHQAFHDALTGLANRALFMDRLGQARARATRYGAPLAVLFLDLDRFKVVNDSLGHDAGDQLLIGVAARLRACLRPGDTIARLGGDEFVILLEDLTEESEAARVAGRLATALSGPFTIGGQDLFITASIGIVLRTADYADADALLRDADLAMYQAKANGRGRHETFDPRLNAEANARLALETDLRRAVGPGGCVEFEIHYQPLVTLATEEITAVEALVRWRHPVRGLIPPAAFIPLAEETGLILPLGRWVLAEACQQAQAWRDDAGHGPTVNVNLSARQFMQPDLVSEVAGILAVTGLDPAALTLEITESVLMAEADLADGALQALRALGVRLAIDDFGTGYSSLAYLQRFPLDALKLDKSFVDELERDPGGEPIVRAVVTLAHALGLTVTAEGVETMATLAHLRTLECEIGQGYYFAKPAPAAEIAALLRGGALDSSGNIEDREAPSDSMPVEPVHPA